MGLLSARIQEHSPDVVPLAKAFTMVWYTRAMSTPSLRYSGRTPIRRVRAYLILRLPNRNFSQPKGNSLPRKGCNAWLKSGMVREKPIGCPSISAISRKVGSTIDFMSLAM